MTDNRFDALATIGTWSGFALFSLAAAWRGFDWLVLFLFAVIAVGGFFGGRAEFKRRAGLRYADEKELMQAAESDDTIIRDLADVRGLQKFLWERERHLGVVEELRLKAEEQRRQRSTNASGDMGGGPRSL